MRTIYLTFLLLPQLVPAQKISQQIQPGTHTVWLATNQFVLQASLMASFRTIDQAVYVDLFDEGEPIGAHDYAAFVVGQDTVVAYSTGPQIGSAINTTLSLHEYVMTVDDLRKLAQAPLTRVIITHVGGFQYVEVPERTQDRVQTWSKALLNAMGR